MIEGLTIIWLGFTFTVLSSNVTLVSLLMFLVFMGDLFMVVCRPLSAVVPLVFWDARNVTIGLVRVVLSLMFLTLVFEVLACLAASSVCMLVLFIPLNPLTACSMLVVRRVLAMFTVRNILPKIPWPPICIRQLLCVTFVVLSVLVSTVTTLVLVVIDVVFIALVLYRQNRWQWFGFGPLPC